MNPKTQQAQFQIATESCMKHTWTKPVFDYLASDHFNGEKFFNTLRNPEPFTRKDMLKWIMMRKSDTWKVDREKEYQQFYAASRSIPQNRPLAKMDDWLVWFVGHATVLIQIVSGNVKMTPQQHLKIDPLG